MSQLFQAIDSVCHNTDEELKTLTGHFNDSLITFQTLLKTLEQSEVIEYLKKPYSFKLEKYILKMGKVIKSL